MDDPLSILLGVLLGLLIAWAADAWSQSIARRRQARRDALIRKEQ